MRGCSSVGRATRLQRVGRRFDSSQLHHKKKIMKKLSLFDKALAVAFIIAILLIASKAFAFSKEQDNFCLAQNIYFEAGNQPLVGKIAVAQVVINRVEDKKFPNDICGVVQQTKYYASGRIDLHSCQFSWYCDGKSDTPTDSKTWEESILLAERVLDNFYPDITEGALWYHSDAVKPYWSKQLNRTVTIDNHLFYN